MAQVPAQHVDDAVEGLERYFLTFVAASRQNHGLLVVRGQVVEKAAHERALAEARLPVQEQDDATACAAVFECVLQRLELLAAPHERARTRMGRGRGCR